MPFQILRWTCSGDITLTDCLPVEVENSNPDSFYQTLYRTSCDNTEPFLILSIYAVTCCSGRSLLC